MHSSFSDLVHAWHDFHVLVGTASATLVGLMFVTGSIGANLFTEKNAAAKGQKLHLFKPPRAPGEKPWWEDDYTVAHKIKDRVLFS